MHLSLTKSIDININTYTENTILVKKQASFRILTASEHWHFKEHIKSWRIEEIHF